MISISKEDYIRAIYKIGLDKNKVKSIDLAKMLGISKPSVSGMLGSLKEKKFIEQKPYSDVKLTKKGKQLATKMTYKHRVIENFVVDILGMSKKAAHEEAHRLEHAFSKEAVDKLYKFLKKPESCPHGQAIPKINKN